MARTAEVVFIGDAASVVRAAREADAAVGTSAKGIEGHNKRIASSGKIAAAGIAGIAVAAYEVKKAAGTLETLSKETLTLHNVTGLSVKSASEYAAVAQTQGLNVKQLNQAFGTLSKNTQAVINAHNGLTKSAHTQENAFKLLGVPVKTIIAAHGDLNKLLPVITKRFEEMPGSITKTAIGMALFGRGWQSLVPLMHTGELGMKEQLETARKMGATLGGSNVKSLKDFMKAQEEAKYGTLGLQLAVGQYLAPALTKLITLMARTILSVRGVIHWFKEHETAAVALAGVIGTVLGGAMAVYAVNKVAKFVGATKDAMSAVSALAGRVKGSSVVVEESFAGQATAAEAAAVKTAATQNALAGDIAAADARIEASNATAAASFAKLGFLGGALAGAGLALADQGESKEPTEHGETEAQIVKKWRKYAIGVIETPGMKKDHRGIHGEPINVLTRGGLTPVAAAGALGNFANEGKASDTGAEGLGIAQWVGSRRTAAEAFLRGKHEPVTSEQGQLEFVLKEIREQGLMGKLNAAKTAKEAAALFMRLFEHPKEGSTAHQERREQSAAEAIRGAAKAKPAHPAHPLAASAGQIDKWAESSVGHFAESWGKNTGPELDKLQAEFHTHAAAWCAEFATTAAMMGGASKAVKTASVATIREWAEAGTHGYRKGVGHTPHVGDMMMFGNDHVGFVTAVHGSRVSTVEGNTSAGKVSRGTRNASEGDFASPIYARSGAGAGELKEVAARFGNELSKLLLSPSQQSMVRGLTSVAGSAHADVTLNAGFALEAGTAWQRARGLQTARAKPLGTGQGNREMTLIDSQDVQTAKAQQVYYARELAALSREVKAWSKLRASYLKFARHATGHAKKEALDKAAGYAGKIGEAKAQAKELHGTIADTEVAIEQAETVLSTTLPGEIQSANLSNYQGALSKIAAEERAGLLTPDQAKAARTATASKALAGGFGALSEEGRLTVLGDLKEFSAALQEGSEALKAHTQALEESAKALKEFAAIASSIGAVEAGSFAKSLADTVSGQIAGVDYHGQRLTAGVGTAARY